MPTVSGSPTQSALSVASTAELSGVSVSPFKNGDLAAVDQAGNLPPLYYQLLTRSTAAVDGTTVLYTRESNPANGAPPGTPGRWLLYNPGGGASSNMAGVVVYRQNAPVIGENIYPTFPAAYEASEFGSEIIVDAAYGSPVIGPPGASYDMSGRPLSGTLFIPLGGGGGAVTVQNGVKLQNLNHVSNILQLQSQSLVPVVDEATPFGTSSQVILLSEGSALIGSPTAPFVDVAPGGNAAAIVCEIGGQIGDGTNPAVSIGAGSVLQLILADMGQLQNNAISGPVGSQLNIQVGSTSAQPFAPQPNFLGTLQIGLATSAENLAFDPSAQSNLWNEPTFQNTVAPFTGPQVQAALANLVQREQVFVFRPAATNPSGLVFNDLGQALTAMGQAQSGFPVLEFDAAGTPGGFIQMPPFVHNLPGNVTLRGNLGFGTNPTRLVFGDGVNPSNDAGLTIPTGTIFEDLTIENNNVNFPPIESTGPGGFTYVLRFLGIGSLIDNAPSAGNPMPMVSVSFSQMLVQIEGQWQVQGSVVGAGPRPIFNSTGPIEIDVSDNSSIGPNSLTYGGGTLTIKLAKGASCSFAQSPPITQPNLPSAGIVYLIDGSYIRSFTVADTEGPTQQLIINHNLGTRCPQLLGPYDNLNNFSANTGVNIIDENNLSVTFSGITITGTWTIGVAR